MGLRAELLAIGPCSADLVEHFDYAAEMYEGCEGVTVVVTVAKCDTAEGSKQLAKMLDIDPWDFRTHHLRGQKFDNLESLGMEGEVDIEGIRALAAAGFEFYFRPES